MATPTNYSLLTTIAVPATAANNQGGAFTAFDISYVDPTSGYYYIADRSNAAVDIVNGSTLTLTAQAQGFTGQLATTSISGPDGVVVVNNGTSTTLFAGDGNSTLRSYNVSNPAAPTTAFAPIATPGTHRVDEMAYSPTANVLLVANNADTPAFGTLINASTGAIVKTSITVPNSPATAGLEQPVWDSKTGTFFVSVPAFNGAGNPGGVAEIDTSGNVLRTIDFATLGIKACSPAGLTIGGSGNLLVGCGAAGTQTVLLNPAGAGSLVTAFTAISGSDEVWYDPSSQDFFVTGANTAGRAFDVISDTSDTVLDSVALPNVNAHSIAVDPLNGDVFVPLEGTIGAAADPLCPGGCIAVFAQAVPEPASLPILAIGLIGTVAVGARRFFVRS